MYKYHVTITTPQGETSNYILRGLKTCIDSASFVFACPISALEVNITIEKV